MGISISLFQSVGNSIDYENNSPSMRSIIIKTKSTPSIVIKAINKAVKTDNPNAKPIIVVNKGLRKK